MSIIKNAILKPIQRLIGIAPASSPTVVDTGNVSLTMPILPDMARRSLASQPTGGWFQGVLENVHSAGDAEISSINPYEAAADAVAPYPIAIDDLLFDLWIVAVGGIRSSGSGGLTSGVVSITPSAHTQGWGRDDVGAPVVASPRMTIASFDAINSDGALDFFITEQGLPFQPLNLRIPRNSLLTFHSTSAAAAEYQAWVLLGLFPAGLGQDVTS